GPLPDREVSPVNKMHPRFAAGALLFEASEMRQAQILNSVQVLMPVPAFCAGKRYLVCVNGGRGK
ncbi:MAG: hypothetical protein KC547_24065, partial [Anaerolineae bacterium]|nr:hypothetical protein [Anaerolineae bacterium]